VGGTAAYGGLTNQECTMSRQNIVTGSAWNPGNGNSRAIKAGT
jgi:hypothetical protein